MITQGTDLPLSLEHMSIMLRTPYVLGYNLRLEANYRD
jgi:hypothetical protein